MLASSRKREHFFEGEKNEEKEGEGGRKKKGRGKGGRKKGGGKISFFTGALYNFYVHSTILKISTPAAGRHFGFFLASLEKNRVGGSVFSFPEGKWLFVSLVDSPSGNTQVGI